VPPGGICVDRSVNTRCAPLPRRTGSGAYASHLQRPCPNGSCRAVTRPALHAHAPRLAHHPLYGSLPASESAIISSSDDVADPRKDGLLLSD
jgi:hypothetical protein